ncbi:MAG: flagellar basal body-associated FliL family protein [Chloroflexota bacterium]
MSKVLSILNIATKVMTFLVVTAIAAISLATAYIMFAPDDLPKPFYLVYNTAPTGLPLSSVEAAVEPTPTPHVYQPGEGVMVNMSTKIINLADPSGRKYIRLTVVLEFAPEETAAEGESAATSHGSEEAAAATSDFETRIQARMPVMDDVVITLLSTKTFEELYTAEGKERLRQELMQAIQERLPEFHLLSVYFTEFVVQ